MTITAVRTERPTERPARRAAELALPDEHLWSPVTEFTLAGLTADAGDAFEAWGLARVAGRSWTLLTATGSPAIAVGDEQRWEDTICSATQSATEAVHVADLRRRKDPVLRAASERWGVRAYVGAPVLAPGGERLGSLCGWSTTPSPDDERLRSRVTRHAHFLGTTLARELREVRDGRLAAWATPPATRDALTRLPDRRAWGRLLQDEDERGRPLAEPAAVTVVDVGAIGSTRGLRRAASALLEVAGTSSTVARTGARQFGVLSCAVEGRTAGAVADAVLSGLADALPQARSGRSLRRGLAPLADVWSAAEADLLVARRGSR